MFYLRKSDRYWLWGSTAIWSMNILIFIFRQFVAPAVLLWMVLLTPVFIIALYPVTRLFDREDPPRTEKGA